MKPPRIKATITEDFKLKFSVPRMLEVALRTIGPGVDVHVEIKKWYKKRTSKQNAVQWALDLSVIQLFILQNTGDYFTEAEIHRHHKEAFLGYEECELVPGIKRLKSTTDLDTVQMAKFREDYCRFWANLGLYIPDPDPDYKGGEK